MFGIDAKAARATWTAAVVLLVLAAIYAVRGTLVVFTIALLLAYLLQPLLTQISRPFGARRRGLALLLTYLLVIGIIASLAIAVGSRVVEEARYLIAHPPDARGLFDGLRASHPSLAPVLDRVEARLSGGAGDIAASLPRVGLNVAAASANLIYLVVIPILSFFFLKDGEEIRDAFLLALDEGERRAGAEKILMEINTMLAQYMRALLILCCAALVVLGVGLTALGVRYALLLATLAFFCEFVPLLGPIVEITVILVVSALTGYPHLWGLLIGLLIFRLVQDYGIWPRLMSRGVELSPLWIIFGVFAGGNIGGMAGVFLAVPVLALGRLLLVFVRGARVEPAVPAAAIVAGGV